MRDLDLTEMESIEGGGCSNLGLGALGLGGASWAFGALVIVSTGGLALWALAGAAIVMTAYDCL